MPDDKPVTTEEEHHEEPVTSAPAPAPVVPEVIEPHKVDDPLQKVIDLITNNHKEVTTRLDLLEKGKAHDTPEGKQEPAPVPNEPAASSEPKSQPKPKRKFRLYRTI